MISQQNVFKEVITEPTDKRKARNNEKSIIQETDESSFIKYNAWHIVKSFLKGFEGGL